MVSQPQEMLATSPSEVISEYFLRVNAKHEPVDIVDDVVAAIFDQSNDLAHREFHLASLLYSIPNPSVEYIVALVKAVLKVDGFLDREKIPLTPKKGQRVVSVAGSGKKGVKTINISTPAAIVAASMGSQVVKHASKATSSVSGSSDFFAEIGGRILDTEGTLEVFNRTGFGLFSIEGVVPKFDALYGGRVLAPTTLSYALPAAISPVRTDSIVYGFSMPRIKESLLAIHELGFRDVIVANSTEDGTKYIDEAGLFERNFIAHSRKGGRDAGLTLSDPVDTLGLDVRRTMETILQRPTRRENVMTGLDALRGQGGPVQNEIVALNAALILQMAGVCEDLREGFQRALDEIVSARPFDKLVEVVEASGGHFNLEHYTR